MAARHAPMKREEKSPNLPDYISIDKNKQSTSDGELTETGSLQSSLSQISGLARSSLFRRRSTSDKANPDDVIKVVRSHMIDRGGLDSGKYDGEVNGEGQRNGHGVMQWKNGHTYKGDWKHDKEDGQGRYMFPSGAGYFGNLKQGRKEGRGKFQYATGKEYIGCWKDDKKHGHGEFKWPNGQHYVGLFRDGFMHGEGQCTFANGDKYIGGWKRGKPDGRGVYMYKNGTQCSGNWKNGIIEPDEPNVAPINGIFV
mmetsp:Transcript_6477/g.9584  ORF Transcript_6477/g.9584 Transcript_6477/m.9584 type:complete len:254 (+) Transcript_6477:3-764(+)